MTRTLHQVEYWDPNALNIITGDRGQQFPSFVRRSEQNILLSPKDGPRRLFP